jgi:ribosomal protein S18 acetylase RimI-like enzyme
MSFIEDVNQSFRHIHRHEGWKGAWEQAIKFILLPFYEQHTGYLLRKSLAEPVVIPLPKIPLEVRQATENDFTLFTTVVPLLRARRFVKKIQRKEEACFIAIAEGKIAGFVWAGFSQSPSTKGTGLTLGPKEAYFWAGYASSEFRSAGVVRTVNLSLCKWLQEQGFESVILLIEEENAASLKHVYHMGYQLEKEIRYLRILNWKRVELTPVSSSES